MLPFKSHTGPRAGIPQNDKKAESVLRRGKKYVIKDFLCLNLRQPLNICFKVRLVLK